MIALEASRRRLKCLLLERDDFGEHTSHNHLRIIHGGLRYLKQLDFRRFRDSTCERSWFLRFLPELAKPLDCLMPLYGEGLYHPLVFYPALAMDGLLGIDRNRGLTGEQKLRFGRILSATKTRDLFPSARPGLKGGLLWQDGIIRSSPRLIMELLRWSIRYGAQAVNYCCAVTLLKAKKRIVGIRAIDTLNRRQYEFHSSVVINAAGPWCREFTTACDHEHSELFPSAVLVWNLLFDRPAMTTCAVAVSAPKRGTHNYFIVPWENRLLTGTGHAEVKVGEHRSPTSEEIESMIGELNAAIPNLFLTRNELVCVYHGIMPAISGQTLAERSVFVDHSLSGGPAGFYSVSGVKFTTARLVADRTLKYIYPHISSIPYGIGFSPSRERLRRLPANSGPSEGIWRKVIAEEAAMSLSDLIFRRSNLAEKRGLTNEDLHQLVNFFSSDKERQKEQVLAVKSVLSARSNL